MKDPRDESNPEIKYPWQQAVFDAFVEFRPEVLPMKVNAAQRAVAAGLTDLDPLEIDERIALQDALRSLRVLIFETKSVESSGNEGAA
jgi:hypothetical protein